MPSYDFFCNSCGQPSIIFHSILEEHPTACPNCESIDFHQYISAPPSVKFNGRGWPSEEFRLDSKTRKCMES